METTEEECIEALRDAAEEVAGPLTKRDYEELGATPAASTILRVVGGWNEAKRRAGLETNPSHGSRLAEKPDDVALPEDAAWSELSQDQRWHYRHTEWNSRRTLQRRQRLRSWLRDVKRERDGCRDCGTSSPECLDFHHVDPEDKTMAINKMVLYGYGRDRIRAELDSCVLLCANCHRLEHSETDGSIDGLDEPAVADVPDTRAEIRQWTQRIRAERGCAECGFTDHRALVFHHDDPASKGDGIAAMIADGRGFDAVRAEAERCTVLCANCHRRVHDHEPQTGGENDSV